MILGVLLLDEACLVCYLANGHIQVLSLPSLRPLMDVDCLPLTDLRFAVNMFLWCWHFLLVYQLVLLLYEYCTLTYV